MALRISVESANADPPYAFVWHGQRVVCRTYDPVVHLRIGDHELCAKMPILVEAGPEDAPAYGIVSPWIFRPVMASANSPTPTAVRQIGVHLRPRGGLTIVINCAAIPPPTHSGHAAEVNETEAVYQYNPVLNAYLAQSATLGRLLDDITHQSARIDDSSLIDIFLLTYRPFLNPMSLFTEVRSRFESMTATAPMKQRIAELALRWGELHSYDLAEPSLRFALAAAAPLFASVHPHATRRFVTLLQSTTPSTSFISPPSVNFVARQAQEVRQNTPQHVAEQLALIDQALFASIKPTELQNAQWLRSATKATAAPSLTAIAARTAALSRWVASLLLGASTEERPAVLSWLIRLVSASFSLHNHAATVGLLAGLQLHWVASLTGAWSALSPELAAIHVSMMAVFLPDNNWRRLRDTQTTNGPHVPYLGPLLAQLVEVETLPDFTPSPQLNVTKLRQVAALLLQVRASQQEQYTFPVNTTLQHHLLALPRLTDEQLSAAASLSTAPSATIPWLGYLDDTARMLGRSLPPLPAQPPLRQSRTSSPKSASSSPSNSSSSNPIMSTSAPSPCPPTPAAAGPALRNSGPGTFGALLGNAGHFASATFASRSSSGGGSGIASPPVHRPAPASAPVQVPSSGSGGSSSSHVALSSSGSSHPLGHHRSPTSSPPTSPRARREGAAPPPVRLNVSLSAQSNPLPTSAAVAQSVPPAPPSNRTSPPRGAPAGAEDTWTGNAYDLMPPRK